jgi:hypothetical protein
MTSWRREISRDCIAITRYIYYVGVKRMFLSKERKFLSKKKRKEKMFSANLNRSASSTVHITRRVVTRD